MPVFNMMQGGGSISGGGDYGTLPQQVTNFKAGAEFEKVLLTWSNPSDPNFSGVSIVRKLISYPTKPSDGVQIYNGSSQTTEDAGLTNGVTYYYRAFAYNSNQEYQTIECFALATPAAYHVYGVCIDTLNSNPETSVTYTEDAIGMTGGSSNWNDTPIFNNIKPCLLKNGVVQYYLSPDNLTKKIDGTESVLTGADGDVMVEIPKLGLKFVNDAINNKQYIYLTDNPDATIQDFHYYAHTRSVEGDKDKLYIGAYLGQDVSGQLHSYSGVMPTNNVSLPNFRTYAQANGTGYDLVSFYPLTLLQALYLLKYKNLDSQTTLGQGLVTGSAHITGTTNLSNRDYGTTSMTQQMCFQNIEDFWGNLRWWIDGFYSNSTYNILTATNNFNNTGDAYTDCGQGVTSNSSGYMSSIQGTSQTGFVPKLMTGSSTTYYSDLNVFYNNTVSCFGGGYDAGETAGCFYFIINFDTIHGYPDTGARLMYL